MRILVVHEVSYPRKVIYEIHEFPELLALMGHDVTFVDFDEGKRFLKSADPRDRVVQGRVHPDARIRLVTPHAFGIHGLDRIWALISCIPVFLRLFRQEKYDVVLNFAVPTYGLQLVSIAKAFGVPVVHRALDVSSEIRRSIWNPLIAKWERLVIGKADSISANNPAMASYVRRILNDSIRPVDVRLDYPPLDLSISKPEPYDDDLAKSLGISRNDQVLVYMGSFFYFSGLPEVIKALAPSMRARGQLKLLLIGGGEQGQELRQIAEELNVAESVIFTGFVEFTQLSRYMSLGDVAINPLLPEQVASVAFPQKVLQYLATGLPVVSTRLSGLIEAFGDSAVISWQDSARDVAEEALRLCFAGAIPSKFDLRKSPEILSKLFSPDSAAKGLESHLMSHVRKESRK